LPERGLDKREGYPTNLMYSICIDRVFIREKSWFWAVFKPKLQNGRD